MVSPVPPIAGLPVYPPSESEMEGLNSSFSCSSLADSSIREELSPEEEVKELLKQFDEAVSIGAGGLAAEGILQRLEAMIHEQLETNRALVLRVSEAMISLLPQLGQSARVPHFTRFVQTLKTVEERAQRIARVEAERLAFDASKRKEAYAASASKAS